MLTRRNVLQGAALVAGATLLPRPQAVAAQASTAGVKFRLGVTDWNLKLEGEPKAVALAKDCGFDGVQISLSNRSSGTDFLGPAVLDQFRPKAETARGCRSPRCVYNILHKKHSEVSTHSGQRWVADFDSDCAEARRRSHPDAVVRRWALKTPAERDYVGDALSDIGPARKRRASSSASKTPFRRGTMSASWSVANPRRCRSTTTSATRPARAST